MVNYNNNVVKKYKEKKVVTPANRVQLLWQAQKRD